MASTAGHHHHRLAVHGNRATHWCCVRHSCGSQQALRVLSAEHPEGPCWSKGSVNSYCTVGRTSRGVWGPSWDIRGFLLHCMLSTGKRLQDSPDSLLPHLWRARNSHQQTTQQGSACSLTRPYSGRPERSHSSWDTVIHVFGFVPGSSLQIPSPGQAVETLLSPCLFWRWP